MRLGLLSFAHVHAEGYAHNLRTMPGIEFVGIADAEPDRGAQAARNYDTTFFPTYEALLAERPDGVVICSENARHRPLVEMAAAAGVHVLCEKPLANSLDQAREMMNAAKSAGVINMINFNYRRVPAVVLARKLIAEGRIGEVRHFRAIYLQDWILDPEFPLVWRLKKELAGSGALGDIAAHIVDLSRYLLGDEIASVTGSLSTFIKERPVEVTSGGGAGLVATGGVEMGQVTVDDSAHFLAKFESGATGTYEVTRLAPGRRNHNQFEINGSKGTIVFDLERLNELEVYFVDDAEDVQGFRKILVTDAAHPFVGNWWPGGHIIGWEHTFTHV
ncbi:MAG: Gfo/Idh/MocA family oxidoreductase, partial [Anaerolineae bacterium]|nr:Gfo/Idh/MocA family oxidoreductase [Anaerolineae bacterium]